MAEEIEIINVGGANGVASEATLKSLVDALEKMGAGGKGAAKEAERYHNEIKKGTTTVRSDTSATKDNTKATDKATKATTTFANKLKGAALGAIGAVATSIGQLGKEFLNGGSQLGDFTRHLPLVGSAISPLVGYIDNSINSFRQLSAVGANFNNSIEEMRLEAARSGMTLDEFTSLVSSNSESMAMLGGSVAGGVRQFNLINRELKNTGAFQSLTNMGFSVMEINEGLADYAAQQARLGRLEGKTTKELAAGAANYMTELDKLARATGKSRKEIEDMQRAQEQDAGFRALLNQFEEGSEEFNNFRTSMTLIDSLGGSAAIALRDLADGVPQSKEAIALVNAAGPEVANAMRRVAQGADPQVLLDALAAAGSEVEGFAQGTAQEKAAFITRLRETNPALAEILDQANQMTNLGKRNLAEIEASQNARDDTTKALTSFETSVREIRQGIQVALVESGIFGMLGGLMGDLADGIKVAAPIITGWLQEFADLAKGQGFGAAINQMVITPMKDAVIDGFTSLFTDMGLLGKIGLGIAGLFTANSVVNILRNSISGLFGGGGSGRSGQAGGRRGGGGGGAGVGKFLGGATEGALTGSARGLAAFANPAIPIGAAALGAAIVAIGAGIAGATWIMGKALPSLAEGLASFADIDGDNLQDVGLGIGAVGVALAAMGAGSAIGAAGTAIASVIEMLPGRGPLERLEEFAKLNFDSAKVKGNAEAMAAYGTAMAAMGGGAALGSIGNAVSNLVDGVVGFFGGDTSLPYDEIREFATQNLGDEAQITKNARLMAAFGNAFSSLPAGGIQGSRSGGLIGAVAGFFSGGEQMPWDQIREFGAVDLGNAERITNNASLMAAFGNALSTFDGEAISDIDLDRNFVSQLQSLANITGGGFNVVADGLTAMTQANLETNMLALNSLDTDSIRNYNVELTKVVENLEQMNTELSKDNNGIYRSGTGTNAGSVVNALGSGEGNGNNQLNTEILAVLNDIKVINGRNQRALDTIARNV